MPARAGRCTARGWSRLYAARAGAGRRRRRIRTAWCAAPPLPTSMWMQHHCGIFRSTDAGVTWTQLKPPGDDFGFAVAAHPQEPRTAWFVPAIKDEMRVPRDGALAVTRTRDGGKTWQSFRHGSAAARRLRPGLPPRPRHRRYRQPARHGFDHRRPVGQRKRRRELAARSTPTCRRSTRCDCTEAHQSRL